MGVKYKQEKGETLESLNKNYFVKITAADFRTGISFPPPGTKTDRHRKTSPLEDTGFIGPHTLLRR